MKPYFRRWTLRTETFTVIGTLLRRRWLRRGDGAKGRKLLFSEDGGAVAGEKGSRGVGEKHGGEGCVAFEKREGAHWVFRATGSVLVLTIVLSTFEFARAS